jgi:hypothetical protein
MIKITLMMMQIMMIEIIKKIENNSIIHTNTYTNTYLEASRFNLSMNINQSQVHCF